MRVCFALTAAAVTLIGGCGRHWECLIPSGDSPDFSTEIGCWEDFDALAADPLDASIPGAVSAKTVIDRVDEDHLYFQNSELYPIHWDFASVHLSGDGLPFVPDLSQFNGTEYTSPDRRFVLGAVTYYEEPDVWAYEVAPYDTATAEMVTLAYDRISESAFFGRDLFFHPTSEGMAPLVAELPKRVKVISTDELFAGITYQPLNLGTSMGLLEFYEDPERDHPSFREIVVLEVVPNDLSAVAGLITQQFQTPLAHVNVLSQNRGTPNMGLKGAWDDPELRALEGQWVQLTVEAMDYEIHAVSKADADAWWEEHKPDPIDVTPMDVSTTELVDAVDVLDLDGQSLSAAITEAVPTFGGKASHYGALSLIGDAVPHPEAFVVPVHYYDQHMTDNGLWALVDETLADEGFQSDSDTRDQMLEALRTAIMEAPIDPELVDAISTKIRTGGYPFTRFRFRSSTNAEDVSGFNGAGLYTSKTGDPDDDTRPVEDAIREVWASVWSYRAYEEREYYSIEHTDIGMALLCHRSFPQEDANGVAITANIFDTSMIEPAFYVNVQVYGESVVRPVAGVTTDQLLYYYLQPGQPIVYLQHSNLVPDDETVLEPGQVHELGVALEAIHDYFAPAYERGGFYGMDVEFKFDSTETGESLLYVKQARPYPGWGS